MILWPGRPTLDTLSRTGLVYVDLAATPHARALLSLPGVGSVNRVGGVSRQIRIELDPDRMQALGVTAAALSMPAMIGLIMLMGVATKNAILLVEYAIVARQQRGLSRLAALLDACSKRARPIIMTTVAMGAGMLPIALGLGTDPSFRAPMAIVIIGGLITSTFLSLLVVPLVFVFIDDLRLRLLGLWGNSATGQATDA